jgi:hypothetical protein
MDMSISDDIAQLARAGNDVFAAGMKQGDTLGRSNIALRQMIAQCREALTEMDDLDDKNLPIEVARMRRLIRDAIAAARETLRSDG